MSTRAAGFDAQAAVTRSMLGWGVVAGPFYLVVGLAQALTNSRFEFTGHALSLLMLADWGWVQRTNLILVGVMVLVAGWGFARAMDRRAVGVALAVFGFGLVASGAFAPDPVDGFPDPGSEASASASGVLHLAFGFVGFIALGIAALAFSRWCGRRSAPGWKRYSVVSGVVVIAGFLASAVLSTLAIGVLVLWLVVLTGLAWLAAASIFTYRTVPHPDADRRAPTN